MFAAAARRLGGSAHRGRRLQPLLLLAAVLAPIVAAAGQVQAAAKASHFVLENGMEVVVVPDRRVPIVAHQVWYRVGAAEDPEGQSGVAHFLEHLMYKGGSERFAAGYIDRFIMVNGGTGNAATSHDYTVYHQRVPKKGLAMLMELEADRMVNLRPREEHIAPERQVVLAERRGAENGPGFLLGERLWAAQFPDHPYGRSVLGLEAEIKTLDLAKAVDLYQRYYAPNNAILVVAGDVTESEVKELAEKTYGRVPARAVPKRAVHPLPDRPLATRVELEHEQVTLPSIGQYYLTPGVAGMSRRDAYALSLLSNIAGAATIGRLYRSLVIDQRLATSVSASYSRGLQAGMLAITATAAPGVSLATVEQALSKEIAALARDGVTESEVDDARRGFLAAKVYQDDNHWQRAWAYGSSLAIGLTVADVEAADDLVAGLTAADVNRLASKLLAGSQPVIGVLLPRSR